MKRTALALFGLVTACTSGTIGVVGDLDGSSDAGLPMEDAASEVDASDAGPNPCDDAGVPPPTLACTGLYANFATKTLEFGAPVIDDLLAHRTQNAIGNGAGSRNLKEMMSVRLAHEGLLRSRHLQRFLRAALLWQNNAFIFSNCKI